MGYDASSYAVVGIVIPANKLVSTEKVKAFNHDYPETISFCPKTGKKLWYDNFVFINGEDYCEHKLENLDVIISNSGSEPNESDVFYFVGKTKEACEPGDTISKASFCSVTEIAKAKEETREVLSKFGLWDESKFGVYPVLVESC